jgi:putative Ca2+/H+ antiporter (TMEM165/GDT1 family)
VLGPFFAALGVVFLAELGDKTQLAALALATRYPAWKVLAGVALGFAVITGFGVLVGGALAAAVPDDVLRAAAGLLFLGFAGRELWELRGDAEDEDQDGEVTERRRRSAVLTSALTIAVAELGDKTQLTAVALAANTSGAGLVGVWAGATLGEAAACGLGIVAGRLLRDRLERRILHLVAAAAFGVAGMATLATLAI